LHEGYFVGLREETLTGLREGPRVGLREDGKTVGKRDGNSLVAVVGDREGHSFGTLDGFIVGLNLG
jgi:hypothetical protein